MELYTVQKIVGKRVRKGGIIQYKVKWLNYDEQDCTWEPVKNLQYVQEMIKAYEEQISKDESSQKRERRPRHQVNYNQQENEEVGGNEDQDQEQNQLNAQADQYEGNQQDKQGEYEQQEDEARDKGSNQKQKAKCTNWDDDQVQDFDIDLQSLSLGDYQQLKTKEQIEHISAPRKMHKYEQQQQEIRKTPEKSLQKSKSKKPIHQPQKKSYLQQVQERTRFIVKAPPKKKGNDQIPRTPKPKELQVLQMSRCNKTNEFIYLTKFGEIITYRRHADMKRSFPDQLIKFYQGKIQFQNIPKISKIK